jgi:hypothetical protein
VRLRLTNARTRFGTFLISKSASCELLCGQVNVFKRKKRIRVSTKIFPMEISEHVSREHDSARIITGPEKGDQTTTRHRMKKGTSYAAILHSKKCELDLRPGYLYLVTPSFHTEEKYLTLDPSVPLQHILHEPRAIHVNRPGLQGSHPLHKLIHPNNPLVSPMTQSP